MDCPGELETTGMETRGWRVNVDTGRRVEAYGVLVAQSESLWRARVFTYPNALWAVPGGNASMKFYGATREIVEAEASEFIRGFCRHRGYKLRGNDEAETAASRPGIEQRRTPRTARFHPVRFGEHEPTQPGGTGDLSESGLFIVTGTPLAAGQRLKAVIERDAGDLAVEGTVRWVRGEQRDGRAAGMGVQLDDPGDEYIGYVRSIL